jgi:hypothetical protein
MTFDELQDKWQSQGNSASINIETDLLLREVKRNQRNFKALIKGRDRLEVSVGFVLTAFFLWIGLGAKAWGFVFAAVMCFGVSMFFIIDRYLQKRMARKSTDSIISCIESSLCEVNHQIWLLKNVFWWYLLPLGTGVAMAVLHTTWMVRDVVTPKFLIGIVLYFIFFIWLYRHIYNLNQKATVDELLPRQGELQEILDTVKKSDD